MLTADVILEKAKDRPVLRNERNTLSPLASAPRRATFGAKLHNVTNSEYPERTDRTVHNIMGGVPSRCWRESSVVCISMKVSTAFRSLRPVLS